MSIGSRIRSLFGPHEKAITNWYRAAFFDLPMFTRRVARFVPEARRILEIGCGEGAVCEQLSKLYPSAQITGIDITPKTGRLFRGDTSRVRFQQIRLEDFAPLHRGEFDLVYLGDVLHHVPWEFHKALLLEAKSVIAPNGYFILKDWENRWNLGHLMNQFSDRILTGDRVKYGTIGYFSKLLKEIFGPDCIRQQWHIAPWPNNIAFLVHPSGVPQ